ncbi:MAG TPA: hypothetical protein VGC24_03695 [Burkholderiaceae bacterium]
MAYYKTNDPATVAAFEADNLARQSIRDAAVAFGQRFGGQGWAVEGFFYASFGGVVFTPPKPTDIWTVATEKGHWFQRPRGVAKKGTTLERREELKQLRAEWERQLPKGRCTNEALCTALGTNWGELIFTGIAMFIWQGAIYVETTAKLTPHMVEILGSEYVLAKEAMEAKKKDRKAIGVMA